MWWPLECPLGNLMAGLAELAENLRRSKDIKGRACMGAESGRPWQERSQIQARRHRASAKAHETILVLRDLGRVVGRRRESFSIEFSRVIIRMTPTTGACSANASGPLLLRKQGNATSTRFPFNPARRHVPLIIKPTVCRTHAPESRTGWERWWGEWVPYIVAIFVRLQQFE